MMRTAEDICRERLRFFNDRAGRWMEDRGRNQGTGRYGRHRTEFARLSALLPLKAGDRVLDAGCGTGVLVPLLLECITASGLVCEMDYADRMIAANRGMHRQDNVRFVVADAQEPPFADAAFDAVVCFSCFPHFHDQKKAVAALARILKPRGVLAVSHFDSSEAINRHHETYPAVRNDRLPEEKAMRSLFASAGLAIDRFIDEPGFYCLTASRERKPERPDGWRDD